MTGRASSVRTSRSQHTVVDIKSKAVSKCLPNSLSYFWVTFGPGNQGYGHVIEDESKFPPYFVHEIIAGITDIDHRKWKNPRNDWNHSLNKVLRLKAAWKRHDPFRDQL